MNLNEIPKDQLTDLMKKAIEDGIQTIDQYGYWLIGYGSGAEGTHKDTLEQIKNIRK